MLLVFATANDEMRCMPTSQLRRRQQPASKAAPTPSRVLATAPAMSGATAATPALARMAQTNVPKSFAIATKTTAACPSASRTISASLQVCHWW